MCSCTFVQLNYVRTRLVGQLSNLDAAVPDIGKLARELQVRWRALCSHHAETHLPLGVPALSLLMRAQPQAPP